MNATAQLRLQRFATKDFHFLGLLSAIAMPLADLPPFSQMFHAMPVSPLMAVFFGVMPDADRQLLSYAPRYARCPFHRFSAMP